MAIGRRELKVFIIGDASSFNNALGLASQAGNKFTQVGQKLGTVGAGMNKFVTLPLLGIGAGAVKAAQSVDDAFDTIRTNTGDTGQTLKGLETSFKNLAKSTPAELGAVATALADVRTNTGLTGAPLEKLTQQILEAGRITGQGVIPVQDITRVYGDWSVATADQSKVMDKLFVASQKGGGTIQSLAQKVVQFGAPLRSLGYNLDTSIALFTRFQKEGVNTETVLAGLRKFLASAAKEGKAAAPFFAETVREIQALTKAGKDAEALDLGRERFGAKTFQDVTRAIQEGRFELDGFVKDIAGSKDTILEVSDSTKDFGERWVEFKNKATIALAPLGESLLPAMETALDKIIPVIDKVSTAFNGLSDEGKNAVLIIGGIALVAGPILSVTGKAIALAGALRGVTAAGAAASGAIAGSGAAAGAAASGPWGALILAGTLLGVGLNRLVEKHFPEVNRALERFGAAAYDVLVDKIGPALERFGGFMYDFLTNKGQGYSLKLNPIVGGGGGGGGGGGAGGGSSSPPASSQIFRRIPENFLAQGGIVDRPTFAMVGEDGAEAIVPLTKPHRAQEVLRQAGLLRDEGPASLANVMRSIPAFAQGGIVGRMPVAQTESVNRPTFAMVSQPSGGTTIHVTVHVAGSVTTERQLVDAIHEGLLKKQSRLDSLGIR